VSEPRELYEGAGKRTVNKGFQRVDDSMPEQSDNQIRFAACATAVYLGS